ncbi:MAG TPA: hypothetical protein VE650_20710 [Acetobacteraceae bacterium]|nr:hypothetical protein [Acetobacteraceae bacterium]
MPAAAPLLEGWPAPSFDAQAQVLVFADQICRMVSIAAALVASRRHVDLAGLNRAVGLLCAKALDLEPGQTGAVRVELIRLAAKLDALSLAIRESTP